MIDQCSHGRSEEGCARPAGLRFEAKYSRSDAVVRLAVDDAYVDGAPCVLQRAQGHEGERGGCPRWADALVDSDVVRAGWEVRYVHSFFRSWESLGNPAFKPSIPDQIVHQASASYGVQSGATDLTLALEVHNLFDARVFDTFGVQKPGRAFYTKATVGFN